LRRDPAGVPVEEFCGGAVLCDQESDQPGGHGKAEQSVPSKCLPWALPMVPPRPSRDRGGILLYRGIGVGDVSVGSG
jgi:hypothetical protein